MASVQASRFMGFLEFCGAAQARQGLAVAGCYQRPVT
jgi:hypothetical protein